MKFKIAIIQSKIFTTISENLNYLKNTLENLNESVDLVTLPEMFNCPYNTKLFLDFAEKEFGETYNTVSELAKKYNLYISAGSIPEIDDSSNIYNTAYVFDRNGNKIAKHRKIHLFDIQIKNGQYFKESDSITAGNEITTFETEFGTMGLCICYDFRFPELARAMVDRGARVILVPASFNMTTGPLHWEIMFRSRSIDNQVYTVGTAPARDSSLGYTSYSNSILVDPWGKVLDRLDENPGIIISEIDLDIVDEVRKQLPLLEHRRNDLYQIIEK